MNVERLTLMATMLDEVANHTWRPTSNAFAELQRAIPIPFDIHFDMMDWGDFDQDCGYCACAIGHALLDQRFESQGLYALSIDNMCPAYKEEKWAWQAIQEFFDISETAAVRLFGTQEYEDPTPAKVAERIRDALENEEINQ